eukprot:TRINITY_DN7676_c0_g2_i4.p1 TRINITY_DN7676_c0_g2~~TRINITY_DN7676_c0_g2_i4.p1  ORF type:complete len:465 (+),score=80.99 TRINITY_DN7676_c0_g2_i4:206-1600(+)
MPSGKHVIPFMEGSTSSNLVSIPMVKVGLLVFCSEPEYSSRLTPRLFAVSQPTWKSTNDGIRQSVRPNVMIMVWFFCFFSRVQIPTPLLLAWFQVKRFLGDGIFMTDDKIWEIQRRLASPLFKKQSLDFMKTVFAEKAVHVKDLLYSWAKSGSVFDVQLLYLQYTLDSFGEIGFGMKFHTLGSQLSSNRESSFPYHFDTVQALLNSFFWDVPSRYGSGPKIFDNSLDEIDKFVDAALDNHQHGNDLLSSFIKLQDADGQPFPKKWIRDIMINFAIAGRDTTALLLTWATYCMMVFPGVQEKAREDVLSNVPPEEEISDDHLKKMKYIDNLLHETLRFFPSVPITSRIAHQDDILPGGIKISAGTSVTYSQYFLHHNPLYWDKPEEFLPERWEKQEMKHPFQYTPFHAGPMQCLGRHMAHIEAKILLTSLLRRFKFELVPNQKIIPTMGIVATAHPGMKVVVSTL